MTIRGYHAVSNNETIIYRMLNDYIYIIRGEINMELIIKGSSKEIKEVLRTFNPEYLQKFVPEDSNSVEHQKAKA